MKKNSKGFTLIELLVVVAIIGILAAVGVVAYNGYTASAKKNAVKTMHDVCLETEKNPIAKTSHHRLHEDFQSIDETIAMSTMYAANHLGVKVIAALTETGKTAMWMSRMSSNISIFAMSDDIRTLRKVTLYRGVYPCGIEKADVNDWIQVNEAVIETLTKNEVVKDGDLVVLTKGMYKGKSGGTNMMKIVRVGDANY